MEGKAQQGQQTSSKGQQTNVNEDPGQSQLPPDNQITHQYLLKFVLDEENRPIIEKYLRSQYTPNQYRKLFDAIRSESLEQQHFGLIGIRKLTSDLEGLLNLTSQTIIETGELPIIINYAKQSDRLQLKLEAVWTLANISAGTSIQCRWLVQGNAIPLFLELLRSDIDIIVQQAISGIGNLTTVVQNRKPSARNL